MSDVSDAARVQVLLADYAVGDASNKLNALGVGFQISFLQPGGVSAPHTLAVLVDVPASFAGTDMALEIALTDEAGEVVRAPGMLGQEAQAVRFAQNITLQDPTGALAFPQFRIPRGSLWCRHQMVATFPTGVPVIAGQQYSWRVSVDTVTRLDWAVSFYVPAPAPGVVLG